MAWRGGGGGLYGSPKSGLGPNLDWLRTHGPDLDWGGGQQWGLPSLVTGSHGLKEESSGAQQVLAALAPVLFVSEKELNMVTNRVQDFSMFLFKFNQI